MTELQKQAIHLKGMIRGADVTQMTDDFLLIHLRDVISECNRRAEEENIDIDLLKEMAYIIEEEVTFPTYCELGGEE